MHAHFSFFYNMKKEERKMILLVEMMDVWCHVSLSREHCLLFRPTENAARGVNVA